MHQAIEGIIDRLIGAVKSDKPHYTLKELLSAGFPPFIVERIRIEINEKLKSEIKKPESRWVNFEDKIVDSQWKDFKQAAFAASHIPKAELYSFVGSVVTEIVKVYLEPRQHMAEYIYKGEDELSYAELLERTNKLTIYKHFGRAIPLYMQKRKLKTLDKKRCKLLIHNLDANLVAAYSAKDWAQVLELLFILYGGEIDAKLIQLFFEDKGLYLTAKAFNALDETISKERFIEILSYPDLLDVKLQEKFREQFRQELIAQKNRFDDPDEEDIEIDENERKLIDSFFGDYRGEQLSDEESLNALFKSEQQDRSIFEEFEEIPDAEKISQSLKEGEQTEEIQRFRENLVSILDEAATSYKNVTEKEKEETGEPPEKKTGSAEKKKKGKEKEKPEKNSTTEKEEPTVKEKAADADEDSEEKQMWEQYITPDQMNILMGRNEARDTEEKEEDDEVITVEDDGFIDEPVVDEQEVQETDKDKDKSDLNTYMEEHAEQFISELFAGSEKAYQKAIKEIAGEKDWKKAAEYLQKEVFDQNKVDMESEVAIEFTDRLQAYFTE